MPRPSLQREGLHATSSVDVCEAPTIPAGSAEGRAHGFVRPHAATRDDRIWVGYRHPAGVRLTVIFGEPAPVNRTRWTAVGYLAGMARLDGSYDVLVGGLGSMGAAAARTLAARGLRVLGLETFGAAHDQGSAHGGTRIVRQSYFEGGRTYPCSAARTRAGTSSRRSRAGTCCGYAVASTLAIPRAPSSPAASRPRACTA